MIYLSKLSRKQSKAFDMLQQANYDRRNPTEPKKDPAYRDMQNIVDKAKRGEKL